jgi:tetratricopeptide (TPR) repeat protein
VHAAPTLVRARLLEALANLIWEFDLDSAVAGLQEAVAIAAAAGDEPAYTEISVTACWINWWHGERDVAAIHATLDRCVAFLRASGDARRLARALIVAGWCYGDVADPRGIELAREGLALARRAGDIRQVVDGLNFVARLEHFRDNYADALAHAAEAAAICRQIGDLEGAIGPLHAMTDAYQALGRYEDARDVLEGLLEQTRIGSPQFKFVWTLNNLGEVMLALGDMERARELFAECLALSRTASGGGHTRAYSVIGLAGIAATAGHARDGARWIGSITAWFIAEEEDWEQPKYFPPEHQLLLQRSVTLVRSAIDPAEFAAAFAEGRALPHEQACDEALAWVSTP